LAKLPEKKSTCLFINAKLWQPDGRFKETFGIENGLLNFSGSLSGAGTIKQKYSRVIDLKGKLVLPSFTDGHVHLVYGSLMMSRIDCTAINTPDELKEKILTYCKKNPGKDWLVGGNLDIAKVFKGYEIERGAVREFLDSIISNKPLYIANYDYHSAVCGSSVIEASGLVSKRNDFTYEEVPIDKTGKPAGIVKEKAFDFVRNSVPPSSLQERTDAVENMTDILHSYGITTVSDITKPSNLEVYSKLYEQGKLKIRINSYLPFEEFANYRQYLEQTKNIPNDLFEIKGFKEYYDGALGSETGLFSENYTGKNYNGYKTEMASSSKLAELAKIIDKAGKQVIIHAIGDKAVTKVLDIAEKLETENGTRDRRLRIEHAQHINENDFDRFKKLNVIASAQPLHMKYDIKIVKEKLPERIVKRTHNYKALMELGVVVNFGTDFPIVEINPFHNMELAVTRKADGEAFLPEYKIDIHNSIKAYTINNAYASFNEHKSGSIEKGKFADFIVMEDNLFEIPESEISNARVHSTYFNGEEVYKSS
jgi:hypothetical protein